MPQQHMDQVKTLDPTPQLHKSEAERVCETASIGAIFASGPRLVTGQRRRRSPQMTVVDAMPAGRPCGGEAQCRSSQSPPLRFGWVTVLGWDRDRVDSVEARW